MTNILLAAIFGAGIAIVLLFLLRLLFRKDKNNSDYYQMQRQQVFAQSTELYNPELRTKKNIKAAAKDFKLIGEIAALLEEGKKLDAIKLVREKQNISLEEAKEVVEMAEDVMEKMPVLFKYQGQIETGANDVFNSQSSLDNQLLDLIRNENLIGAIKMYKETNNTSLLEAKNYCEGLAAKHNLRN